MLHPRVDGAVQAGRAGQPIALGFNQPLGKRRQCTGRESRVPLRQRWQRIRGQFGVDAHPRRDVGIGGQMHEGGQVDQGSRPSERRGPLVRRPAHGLVNAQPELLAEREFHRLRRREGFDAGNIGRRRRDTHGIEQHPYAAAGA